MYPVVDLCFARSFAYAAFTKPVSFPLAIDCGYAGSLPFCYCSPGGLDFVSLLYVFFVELVQSCVSQKRRLDDIFSSIFFCTNLRRICTNRQRRNGTLKISPIPKNSFIIFYAAILYHIDYCCMGYIINKFLGVNEILNVLLLALCFCLYKRCVSVCTEIMFVAVIGSPALE